MPGAKGSFRPSHCFMRVPAVDSGRCADLVRQITAALHRPSKWPCHPSSVSGQALKVIPDPSPSCMPRPIHQKILSTLPLKIYPESDSFSPCACSLPDPAILTLLGDGSALPGGSLLPAMPPHSRLQTVARAVLPQVKSCCVTPLLKPFLWPQLMQTIHHRPFEGLHLPHPGLPHPLCHLPLSCHNGLL